MPVHRAGSAEGITAGEIAVMVSSIVKRNICIGFKYSR